MAWHAWHGVPSSAPEDEARKGSEHKGRALLSPDPAGARRTGSAYCLRSLIPRHRDPNRANMALRTLLVLAALQSGALCSEQSREFFRWDTPGSRAGDLVYRRQTAPPGYHPEFGSCGSGTTCENACGANWLSCNASTTLSLFCYNQADLGQTCCENGSGRACERGYYCAWQELGSRVWCCEDGQSLEECGVSASTTVSELVTTTSTTVTNTAQTDTTTTRTNTNTETTNPGPSSGTESNGQCPTVSVATVTTTVTATPSPTGTGSSHSQGHTVTVFSTVSVTVTAPSCSSSGTESTSNPPPVTTSTTAVLPTSPPVVTSKPTHPAGPTNSSTNPTTTATIVTAGAGRLAAGMPTALLCLLGVLLWIWFDFRPWI
ncbi:hypothetical protein B0T26DRAFT_304193 [Lasiosphaeria miniovina]|uniref:Uncharacterized protein n=1 Tax=Lasiosphaeria miniovina TaxID=1954250 RepID=A0AA40AL21_9PEZI|nr:uncharacterized protein B0T26DRAFT_304193 [Lasiosphaeria miniovina]KAK0717820.1 hypothetical protein B0T26DRAFT_304193 [Lasiosphaeria miniovina]